MVNKSLDCGPFPRKSTFSTIAKKIISRRKYAPFSCLKPNLLWVNVACFPFYPNPKTENPDFPTV
jgi:hypothetical protein